MRSSDVRAYVAIEAFARRYPMVGLGVRPTGTSVPTPTGYAYEVERIRPNAYLVRAGYPEKIFIDDLGSPLPERISA